MFNLPKRLPAKKNTGSDAGNFERKGRENYAKDAKGAAKIILNCFVVFFASFANPLRPLRSKIPVFLLCTLLPIAHAQNIGRPATPAEIKAWDIDVRPDFKGLPKGSGSVQQGEGVWEGKCASCHGSFGESNEVFPPLVGYTTAADVKSGRVASLQRGADAPTRTTMMKSSQLSTLWDYIARAMPWTAPKSLSTDEVYAVTAYLLNMANVVPGDYVLSDANMAQTQARIPNRLGMTTAHSLWPNGRATRQKSDVQGSACMQGCNAHPVVASSIPAYAKSAHGDLAQQFRLVGASRGVQTLANGNLEPKPQGASVDRSSIATKNIASVAPMPADISALLQRNSCTACHAQATRLLGPSFAEIAAKHGARPDALAYLAGKIRLGSQGVWGAIPMPAQAVSEADAATLARWLAP